MRKIVFCSLVLSGALLFAGCNKQAAPAPTSTPKAHISNANVNLEPVNQRPYVWLAPSGTEDPYGPGKSLVINVTDLKQNSKTFDYEVEYDAGSLVQGFFDSATNVTLPYKSTKLFGTCSTGGKCTFNTGVTGGTLTIQFDNNVTLQQEWSWSDVRGNTIFPSRDGKFGVDLSGAKTKATNAVVYQTPGYPGTAPGEIVAGPYTVGFNAAVTGTVKANMHVGDVQATIYGYDGKQWNALKTTVSNGQASAVGDLMQAYMAVKK
ncbi:hypothetical protein C5B42_01170 [Candidatus Cerribacteria bacterium 'Amazon FNV 2010 28 9']|uniref:Cohesin domain-containing protein n=1 Tax=Candidatus Cerribacteria bacterium 'Amazon FNV 2010 28 9' TaxID=2081795 RepID=A0A317JQ19_9BACT|nr:MAG: hypothetical protein C5B42_01170 [Candidatus Cerribacteria bacterium 'Amazon FNV 2010 28 9']